VVDGEAGFFAKGNEVEGEPGMRATRPESERGFSLIELMVAMFITMLISGAIYTLLSSGQNAFRREPEVSDRQQNIRLAMDVIMKDVLNAGSNVPAFVQVFTNTDPTGLALNAMGPPGAMGTAAAGLRSGDSVNSDVLEMIAAEDRCPAQSMCTTTSAPGSAGGFGTREFNPNCASIQNFTLQTDNVNLTIQPTLSLASIPCPGGGANNGGANLGAAVAVGSNPVAPAFAAPGGGIQAFLYSGRVARYMIAVNPDPLDAVPVLWRSVTGRYDRLGALPGGPLGAAGSPWQMVARGIEDMQVEYRDGTNAWTNSPPFAVACGTPDSCVNAAAFTALVREVRVTLSARTAAPLLQGGMNAAAGGTGPNAIRGRLVSSVQPRATLWALQMGGQIR
jgi:prepilin-type N-terminal cleavage/methylation domain-containing protein